jgi:HK97 family phage portal protein
MGWRKALRLYRGTADAVPPGAYRPTMTQWYDPGGVAPPVSWAPRTGEFETHWDWSLSWAVAIPGVWRARMLIAQAIGAMPIGAWEGNQAMPLPAVLRQPNPPEDRCATVAAWVCDLLDHGNAVGRIVHQPTRAADTIIPWPSTTVAVGRTETGRIVYTHDNVSYDSSEVFHVKGMSGPNDLRGIGILEAGLSTIQRLTAESAYASKAFNSGVPSGLLRVRDPDLQVGTDDDPPGYATAKGIKKQWKASVATGDVAVLSELVDFTPLSWTPTDAQMVEARQLSLVDVANMFNLDPYWVGSSQTSAPYQNVQDAAVQLSRFSLGYWITALEAQFSKLIPDGAARFNRDTILRDPMSTRVDNYTKLIQAGIMGVDEIRALEGLPPIQPSTAFSNVGAPPPGVTPLFPAGDTDTNEPAVGE